MRSVLVADGGFRCVIENSIKKRTMRFLEDAGYNNVSDWGGHRMPSVIPKGELVRNMTDLAQLVARPKPPLPANQMWRTGTIDDGEGHYYTYPTTARGALASGHFYFYVEGTLWKLQEEGYELQLIIVQRSDMENQYCAEQVKGSDTLATLRERCSHWKLVRPEYNDWYYVRV